MNRRTLTFLGFILLSCTTMLLAEGEDFEPTSESHLDTFYANPQRRVTVSISESQKLHAVLKGFLGINLSYFNVTDEIWQKYDILPKLQKAGVGSLRYPGGEETSFFHWEHPGVNGYEDLWDPKQIHGVSPGRGKFQTTWVSPEKWAANQDFMDFDEFMNACRELDAEPIVGLNLSSGKKHNRQKDGIDEALRWMRYCKNKGYNVKYWYLDNEPWHFEAAHTFTNDEYADEVLAYGQAIKKEFPDVKLIANPTSSSSYNWWEGLDKFISDTKSVIDFIDVHWYWGWGLVSFENWLAQTPLETGDKWKKKEWFRPFPEDIRLIQESFKRAGAPHLKLVCLEWNIGPSNWSQTFNQSLLAIIQAELLMEFAKADVRLTCMWPLLWQTSRDVWSEQDFFPSIITQDPPFNPTLSLDMFRMLSPIQGKTIVSTQSSRDDLRVLAAMGNDKEKILLLINKNALRRKITVTLEENIIRINSAEMIGLKHQVCQKQLSLNIKDNEISLFVEPYSFVAIQFK
ncbi:MAG: hypothetical protein JW860_08985 [Sedimentisphaerales bacterium]|nr:hypothetical protein [Sedimentisphaerales bacterium]